MLPEVKEVQTTQELPEFSIMFHDDLEYALGWLSRKEDVMTGNGIRVVQPLDIYKYKHMLAFVLEQLP